MPAVDPASVRSHLLKMLDMEEPDKSKPHEDMSPATNLMSDFLAISQTSNACSIHEECDVSCSNERYSFEPLMVGTRKLRLSNSLKDIGQADLDFPVISVPNVSRADTYSHKPLNCPSEKIRLIEIKPARLRTDPLVATVRETSLDQAPKFAALSYFWGPPQFDAEIIVNDAILAITSNLAGSLRRYRQRSSKRTAFLWVDAICINQNDKYELSNQLLLMRRIYQEAQMVYIDLGEVDPAWYFGFDLLHRLAFIYEWIKDSPEQDFSVVSTSYGIPSPDHLAWEAFYWLFTMPWFTRTWIVQEAAWAKQSEIMFGIFTFRWDTLVDAWNLLVQFGLLQPSFGDMSLAKGLLGLRDILSVRQTCRVGFSNMLHVMQLTREFKTTDARDKCYAVFSLLQDGPVGRGFTPNYALPVETVYQQFAAYLVRMEEGAKMLSYAGLQRRRNILNISSWVPDWTLQSPAIAPKALFNMRNLPYQAASSVESCVYTETSPSHPEPVIIFVQGAVVDSITRLSEAFSTETSTSLKKESQAWYQTSAATYNTALEKEELTYSDPADAFARTLLVDDTYSGGNACPTTTPISDPARALAQAISLESPETSVWASKRRDEVGTVRLQITTAGSGRRFAVTNKGRMGLVPWCAKVGDGVCVVLGSSVLFVVRKEGLGVEEGKEKSEGIEKGKDDLVEKKDEETEKKKGKEKGSLKLGDEGKEKISAGEKWILIGDAYVHQLMNGEALAEEGFTERQMRFC